MTPTGELKGRVALVTGSSRGIGFEIARFLGREGARVVLCARNLSELKLAKARLTEIGIEAEFLDVDLTRPQAAEQVVSHSIQTWGSLDILVNNVGGLPQTGDFFSLDDQAWSDLFELNVMTTVRFCKSAIPFLKKSDQGRILNISSFVARQPGKMNPHYSFAKAGILNLTKHLSNLLASDGVTVNSISPGNIATEGWASYIVNKAKEEGRSVDEVERAENSRAAQSIPLGRLGTPQEVAALALFLCSSGASFVTGADYVVDGGKITSI